MTDDPDQPDVDGYMVVGEVGRTPPHWYPWTIKLLLAITALLAVGAFAAETFYLAYYLAPTARSNAEALRTLAQRTQIEKDKDTCYERYSADISAQTAAAVAALADGNSAIGGLVVLLAAQPRDPEAVDAAIQRISIVAARALTAATDYEKSVKRRDDYVAAGEPLPCPNH